MGQTPMRGIPLIGVCPILDFFNTIIITKSIQKNRRVG